MCYAEAASPRITETSICAAQQLFNSSCWAVSRLVEEVSLPPPQAKCLPQIVWVRRFSHRIHRIHRNSCWGHSPTDFTDLHRLFGCVDSPTESTEFTETLAGDILPQISQIGTDCLGAYILPQISQNSQKLLLGIFSHRFHGSAQIVWVRRFSHRFHRIHRNSCGGYSPTESTDLTEVRVRC